MKQIEIIVKKGGKIKIEAHGYQGSGCEDATRFMANRLGGNETSAQQKPEYFETPQSDEMTERHNA